MVKDFVTPGGLRLRSLARQASEATSEIHRRAGPYARCPRAEHGWRKGEEFVFPSAYLFSPTKSISYRYIYRVLYM